MQCFKSVLICLLISIPRITSQEHHHPPLQPLHPEGIFNRNHQNTGAQGDINENHLQQTDANGDPIVGLGMGLPIAQAMAAGAQAKAKAAMLHGMVGAQALAFKAKADFHKHILDAKIKHDLAAAKARAATHQLIFNPYGPRLGATHKDGQNSVDDDTGTNDGLNHPVHRRSIIENVESLHENNIEKDQLRPTRDAKDHNEVKKHFTKNIIKNVVCLHEDNIQNDELRTSRNAEDHKKANSQDTRSIIKNDVSHHENNIQKDQLKTISDAEYYNQANNQDTRSIIKNKIHENNIQKDQLRTTSDTEFYNQASINEDEGLLRDNRDVSQLSTQLNNIKKDRLEKSMNKESDIQANNRRVISEPQTGQQQDTIINLQRNSVQHGLNHQDSRYKNIDDEFDIHLNDQDSEYKKKNDDQNDQDSGYRKEHEEGIKLNSYNKRTKRAIRNDFDETGFNVGLKKQHEMPKNWRSIRVNQGRIARDIWQDTRNKMRERRDVNDQLFKNKANIVQDSIQLNDNRFIRDIKKDTDSNNENKNNNEEESRRRSNMKRDERLFVWSLNNMSPYKRSAQQPHVNIHVLGNPFFWNNNEIIPFSINVDDLNQQSSTLLPIYPDVIKEKNNRATPVHYHNPSYRSSDEPDTPQKTFDGFRSDAREAHFHHSIFHHHHDHGFHKTGHFNSLHSSSFEQPAPPSHANHWGQPGNQNAINNLLPQLNPSHVTINNQQNTFSNAVPTSGSQTIQISQTNGQATSSQAQASNKRSNEETVSAPYLLQFPYRRHVYERSISSKNFNDILMDENLLKEKHIKRGDLKHSNNIQKRSLPLIKLMADPNAKLDMPKTLSNVGTIARNSFEDKHAPMYHVRNMVGSVKNAVLSTLKIAPQDIIIPSQYRIVDTNKDAVMKHEDVLQMRNQIATEKPFAPTNTVAPEREKPLSSLREKLLRFRLDNRLKPKVNEARLKEVAFTPKSDPILGQSAPTTQEDDPFNFLGTFQKVGTILRDSIKSGQETIQHVSDAAHSARKVLHTSRFAAPRVLLPYTRAAALKKDNPIEKLMYISPRFLDVGDSENVTPIKDDKFVRMGEIMDAVGMSNPNEERVGLRKITIQKNNPLLQSRFGGESGDPSKYVVIGEDIEEDFPVHFGETWKTLEGIKSAVGVNTVKDFLHGMKNDFNSIRLNMRFAGDENLVDDSVNEDDELNSFLKDLFTKGKDLEVVGEKLRARAHPDSERVGAGLNLAPNLLEPFMAQASKTELNSFLKDNGDSVEDVQPAQDDLSNFLTGPSLVSSINPDMFQKIFNETLKINTNATIEHPEKLFKGDSVVGMPNPGVDEDELRTSMKFHDKLLEPYMGKLKDKEEDYGQPYGDYGPFNNYGYYDEDDEEYLYRNTD